MFSKKDLKSSTVSKTIYNYEWKSPMYLSQAKAAKMWASQNPNPNYSDSFRGTTSSWMKLSIYHAIICNP